MGHRKSNSTRRTLVPSKDRGRDRGPSPRLACPIEGQIGGLAAANWVRDSGTLGRHRTHTKPLKGTHPIALRDFWRSILERDREPTLVQNYNMSGPASRQRLPPLDALGSGLTQLSVQTSASCVILKLQDRSQLAGKAPAGSRNARRGLVGVKRRSPSTSMRNKQGTKPCPPKY